MALREPKLRESTGWLRGQVKAGEPEHDNTQLFEAAQQLLIEIDKVLDTLEAVEPDNAAEGAA